MEHTSTYIHTQPKYDVVVLRITLASYMMGIWNLMLSVLNNGYISSASHNLSMIFQIWPCIFTTEGPAAADMILASNAILILFLNMRTCNIFI